VEGNRRVSRLLNILGDRRAGYQPRRPFSAQGPFYNDYAFGGAVSVVHLASSGTAELE